MEYGENYIVFGIVSALTGFWHAAALLLILQNQAFGWLLGVVSVLLVWGMKRYVKWLFPSLERRHQTSVLISCQAVSTIMFVFVIGAMRP